MIYYIYLVKYSKSGQVGLASLESQIEVRIQSLVWFAKLIQRFEEELPNRRVSVTNLRNSILYI